MARLIRATHKFERDTQLMGRRGKDLAKLQAIIQHLAHDEPLQPRHRDHALTGNYRNRREYHIEPDWLLIYALGEIDGAPALFLYGTGTHSDLFG